MVRRSKSGNGHPQSPSTHVLPWRRALLCLPLTLVASIAHAQALKVEYIHTDALGSPVAVTNAAGEVIERTDWQPYGEPVGQPLVDGVGYTGHVNDAATGLTYMQQRYYDPSMGRFLSMDPVAANPGAQFNRYHYASNNPYSMIDPDGRRACGTDSGCRLREGDRGGSSQIAGPRTAAQAASLATRATTDANQRLTGIRNTAFPTQGKAARAWANRVQPVADKYRSEIFSHIFTGLSLTGSYMLGNAVSDGLEGEVGQATIKQSISPLGSGELPIGAVHTHPVNSQFSNYDKAVGTSIYSRRYDAKLRNLDVNIFVSTPNASVKGWSALNYSIQGEAAQNVYTDH